MVKYRRKDAEFSARAMSRCSDRLAIYSVQDGPTHVSVRPVGATMEEINAGSSSIWTQAVKSVVIKWDGG